VPCICLLHRCSSGQLSIQHWRSAEYLKTKMKWVFEIISQFHWSEIYLPTAVDFFICLLLNPVYILYTAYEALFAKRERDSTAGSKSRDWPPQAWLVPILIDTCDGNSPGLALVPPTMRLSVSRGGPSMKGDAKYEIHFLYFFYVSSARRQRFVANL
jgi:hypothetical protein